MQPLLRTFFSLHIVVITASTKLTGEIFRVQHSLYAASKIELGRPSVCGKNGLVTNEKNNTNKNENFSLISCFPHTLS